MSVTHRFEGQVAIVTGAGSGVGRATSARLAAEGAAVVVGDIDETAARGTVERITEAGGTASTVVGDVSREATARALAAAAVERYGRLDILHNNAAALGRDVYGRDGSIADLDVEVWDRTLAVNATGALLCCKHAWPAMRAADGGSIVNTVSIAAFHGGDDHAAYGVSKAAVVSLTRYVASMCGPDRIRCNAVAPGLILSQTALDALSAADMTEYEAERALPWPSDPEDIANVVVWLCSDEARCVTGQTIVVDSGVLARRPRDSMHRFQELLGVAVEPSSDA